MHPIRQTTRWTGRNWLRLTTHTTSIARPVLPPGVTRAMGNAVVRAWRCGWTIKMPQTLTHEILYRHPDGWTINYAGNALIAIDDDLNFVIVPIGHICLLELSKKL